MKKTAALLTALLLPTLSFAAFHVVHLDELMTGANGDTTVQFIEFKMDAGGQNFFAGHQLVSYNSDGSTSHTYTFSGNHSASNTNDSVLVATPHFAAAAGITPDFANLPNGFLFPGGGRLEWVGGSPTQDNVVVYGTYTGPGGTGTPAPAAPGSNLQSLTRVSRSGNDTNDWALAANSPRNAAGQTGNVTGSSGVAAWSSYK